jgi:mono/diheme cytochrome c family protein
VQWLEEFLADPDKHYGENNAMPAFAEQLTPQQLRLLSRWLAEDYYVPGH